METKSKRKRKRTCVNRQCGWIGTTTRISSGRGRDCASWQLSRSRSKNKGSKGSRHPTWTEGVFVSSSVHYASKERGSPANHGRIACILPMMGVACHQSPLLLSARSSIQSLAERQATITIIDGAEQRNNSGQKRTLNAIDSAANEQIKEQSNYP